MKRIFFAAPALFLLPMPLGAQDVPVAAELADTDAAAVEAEPACPAAPAPSTPAVLPGSGLQIDLPGEDAGGETACPEPAPPPPPRPPSPDIFRSVAVAIGATTLDARWRAVRAAPMDAHGPWADLIAQIAVAERSEQIRLVNNWVNARIAYVDDGDDDWASIEATFARAAGDCEDYAIAKMQILEKAGVPFSDLYFVIVRDQPRQADHAVLAVRLGADLYILDSRTNRLLRDAMVSDYKPILSFSGDYAWTHGYRSGALTMGR